MIRRERTLPKWAQQKLSELREELLSERESHRRTRLAHAVLTHPTRDWFLVQGPPQSDVSDGVYHLWYGIQHAACSLGIGDVVLVGRAK